MGKRMLLVNDGKMKMFAMNISVKPVMVFLLLLLPRRNAHTLILSVQRKRHIWMSLVAASCAVSHGQKVSDVFLVTVEAGGQTKS